MKFRLQFVSMLAAALLFGTAAHAQVQVGKSYARATVPQQQSAGAYLILENRGKEADRLVAVSTPVARSVELHTMALDGNVMRMREVGAIDLGAGARIEMKPGEGFHVMLMGLQKPLTAGDSFPMTLQFEKAGKIEINVTVEAGRGAAHHKH